jgi:hypothetical protein
VIVEYFFEDAIKHQLKLTAWADWSPIRFPKDRPAGLIFKDIPSVSTRRWRRSIDPAEQLVQALEPLLCLGAYLANGFRLGSPYVNRFSRDVGRDRRTRKTTRLKFQYCHHFASLFRPARFQPQAFCSRGFDILS